MEQLARLEHTSVGLQRNLDARSQLGRDKHTCRQACEFVALGDDGAALCGDAICTIEDVVVECRAILRLLTLLVFAVVGAHLLVAFLCLLALNVHETLLRLDRLVSLVVVGKHLVPSLLLFGSKLSAVTLLTHLLQSLVSRSAFLL